MIVLKKAVPFVLALGTTALLIHVGSKKVRGAVSDKVLKGSEKPGSPADYAVTLQRSFQWSSGAGNTDEELLFTTLASIGSAKEWNSVKSSFSQLTGKGLIGRLDSELDTWENMVAKSIYQVWIPDPQGETEAKRMFRKLSSWAHQISWWLARGKPWYGSQVDDFYAGKALSIFELISHASLFPILSQVYQYHYQESLIGLLLLRFSDDHWAKANTILTNKPDARNKTITQIFGG